MSRRSRRRGRKGRTGIVALAACVVVALAGGMALMRSGEAKPVEMKSKRLSPVLYAEDASRLVGNRYRLEGRVDSIVTEGDVRIIELALDEEGGGSLPLVLTKETKSDMNVTRGDSFAFDVVCKSGRTKEGGLVKGVLVVEKVSLR